MNAYVMLAAPYCEDCGKNELEKYDNAIPFQIVPNGGGEADSPQHCHNCDEFLENPLTDDGYEYVENAIHEFITCSYGDDDTIKKWFDFYGFEVKRRS